MIPGDVSKEGRYFSTAPRPRRQEEGERLEEYCPSDEAIYHPGRCSV